MYHGRIQAVRSAGENLLSRSPCLTLRVKQWHTFGMPPTASQMETNQLSVQVHSSSNVWATNNAPAIEPLQHSCIPRITR